MGDRGFRFGVVATPEGGPQQWTATARRVEELGYSTLLMPDGVQLLAPFPSLAMAASESGYWDWDVLNGRYFASSRANEMIGFPPENTYVDRNDFRARVPMHPEDWPDAQAGIAGLRQSFWRFSRGGRCQHRVEACQRTGECRAQR